MTVQQLIDGLKNYNPDLPVKFVVPPETWGRSATHYPINNFDVEYPEIPNNPDFQKPITILLKQ